MRKPVLRRGPTIWQGRTAKATRYPALRGHHETGVAIVGGGLTGALTAEAFVRAGARVTIVEAARVGQGSTAASTALLLQEPDYDLGALTKRYGARDARRIWQMSQDAARDFIDTLRRLRIRCDLRERHSLYYTLSDERAVTLQRELRRRQRAGFEGEWLDAVALEQISGIRGAGAIRTRGNAQLNPLAATLGLLDAAVANGADVFERTSINRIRQFRDGVRLYSSRGRLDARQVVIATGYATRYFRPLAGRFKMRHTYVLATSPTPKRLRRSIGMGDVLLWDTERPYHYVRWTDDDRLLLGGEDRPVKPGARRDAQFTDRDQRASRLLPRGVPVIRRTAGRLRMGRTVRDDAGRPALYRPAPSLSAARFRAGLWRQRQDLRRACRAHSRRTVARPGLTRPRLVCVQSLAVPAVAGVTVPPKPVSRLAARTTNSRGV